MKTTALEKNSGLHGETFVMQVCVVGLSGIFLFSAGQVAATMANHDPIHA